MSQRQSHRFWSFVIDNYLLLIAGTVIGLVWANVITPPNKS
jgi:hypothetical protein